MSKKTTNLEDSKASVKILTYLTILYMSRNQLDNINKNYGMNTKKLEID